MGSCAMSITTSLQSQCEECLDDDKHAGLFDGKRENDIDCGSDGILLGHFAEQRDAVTLACLGRDFVKLTSDGVSGSLLKWQNEGVDACSCLSRNSGESAVPVGTTVRAPFEAQKDQKISNIYVEASDSRKNSSSLSRSNKESGYIHPVDAVRSDTQQSADDHSNHTASLHQRLALLEGRGQMSSIGQAVTERTNPTFFAFHKNASLEENDQNFFELTIGSSCQESNPPFSITVDEVNKPAVTELSHRNQPSTLSNSTSRKTERLKYDQQELEDRLFPHRKLLRSRISLQNGVMESRAALHSKLENGVSQSFSANDVHIAGLIHLSVGNQTRLRPMNGKDQCCSSILEVRNEIKFEAPHLNERMCPSNCVKFHLSEKCFVDNNPPTAIKKAISDLDDPGELNGGAHRPNIGGPLDLKMLCPPGQIAPYLAEVGMEEADRNLQFLQCDETLQFNSSDTYVDLAPDNELEVESDEMHSSPLCPIGQRVATGGWYACDGEAIVLVHDDGCCSFYDVANMEEKALYKCPEGYPTISWSDCWMIRAPGSDGPAKTYIVASTSGSALDAGFCSWDFHSKALAAHHIENHFTCLDLNSSPQCSPPKRSPELQTSCLLRSLASNRDSTACHSFGSSMTRANVCFSDPSVYNESSKWWYRPCGPLMVSAGTSLKQVAVYDIRDGEKVMTWETKQPIKCLDYSSPVQWRNNGKLALAEEQAISIWDVNSLNAQGLHYIELPGKRVCAMHVHNADAEYSGGVRQRLSSSDMEAFDGICCTQDNINILDFRVPSGVGICLPTPRQEMQSVYARGDMVLIGGKNTTLNRCFMQQWSVRMAQLVCTYAFQPASHQLHLSIPQVWGNSNTVMAVNGTGLHIFKGHTELTNGHCGLSEVKEVKGMPNLFNPSFDYSNRQVLLISRDRPARWCYWAM
ncbi:hypothetical protein GOP47_0030195 [Adiantum capillus-veneris]|nr:hypothetical protein GOP47_0030195 [Adiantum capillus-veneris]